MNQHMKAIVNPNLDRADLLFLWGHDDEFGFFITRTLLNFVEKFVVAKENSNTWEEFLGSIGDYGRDFIAPFLENDDIQPKLSSPIAEIADDIWILSDIEFPLTQCVEETYSIFCGTFLDIEGKVLMKTEYGHTYELYPKIKYLEIKEILEKNGYSVDSKLLSFPAHLYNY
jgi:hypothetical protein